jgi:hypothetical protein
MKNLFRIVAFSGIFLFFAQGCKKGSSESAASQPAIPVSGKPGISLSNATVARGQQVNVTVLGVQASTVVKWSIYPNSGATIMPGQGVATAFFGNAGNYKVTAYYCADSSAAPFDSASSPVTVSNTVYVPQPPVQSDTSALWGDRIYIQPLIASGGGLYLAVQTGNLYPCQPQLQYYYSQIDNTIQLFCLREVPGTDCSGPATTAKAFVFTQPLTDGVYNFQVILNTATYPGTLTVTNGNYTFTWNNAPYVTISPLQVATQ